MVLDDLGLGPTLRRAASDRARRSGISVDFDSQGNERRLDARRRERRLPQPRRGHGGLPRAHEPPSVIVRLDWSEQELIATVSGHVAASRARTMDMTPASGAESRSARCRRRCWR